MTPEPQVGDLINVTITGARVIDTNPPFAKKHGPAVLVALPGKNGEDAKGAIWTDLSAITIEIVEPACPAEWPPRIGDLWRDRDGDLWFGISVRDASNPGTRLVDLVSDGGGSSTQAAEVHRLCGPLTLVRRETDDPAVRACSMDPHPAWPPRAGDVWKDCHGDDWTAVNHTEVALLLDGTETSNPAEWVRETYGPLDLFRRKYGDQ